MISVSIGYRIEGDSVVSTSSSSTNISNSNSNVGGKEEQKPEVNTTNFSVASKDLLENPNLLEGVFDLAYRDNDFVFYRDHIVNKGKISFIIDVNNFRKKSVLAKSIDNSSIIIFYNFQFCFAILLVLGNHVNFLCSDSPIGPVVTSYYDDAPNRTYVALSRTAQVRFSTNVNFPRYKLLLIHC